MIEISTQCLFCEFRVKYVLKATIAISLCAEGMLKECEFVGFGKRFHLS